VRGKTLLGTLLISFLVPCGFLLGSEAQLDDSTQSTLSLLHRGQYKQLEQALTGRTDALSLRLVIELGQRSGNLEQVEGAASRLLQQFRRGSLQTAAELNQAAYAAWSTDQWQEANEIFIQASELDSVPADLFVDWGNLYLEKYNASEADQIFTGGVAAESSRPGRWGLEHIWLGKARALRDQNQPGADEALKQASKINPDSLDLLSFLAVQSIQENNWSQASEKLDRGFEISDQHIPLLEAKAAFHHFQGQEKDFEKLQKRIYRVNPTNASLPELLGDLCIPRRRLEEAVAFYRQAVENNPRRWSALASLGINLLRMGEEDEGISVLEKAYENDPFNIWTVNTLRLVDSFQDFDRFETEHFRIKLQKDESAALRPSVEQLLERSLVTISEKYSHSIEGKYIFEMYGSHDDFAVRTLGLPGLGALGATFGRVVAMDSPSARPDGKFHWGSTLWHEVAHIVTLSISNQKVPRWLTEGISMMEERQGGRGWGDPLSRSFVKAYQAEKLLPLVDLNSGFERPRFQGQLELSYFQAGWVCEFLAANYGEEAIRDMLLAFGQGQSQEEVFEAVLGKSVEEVGGEFQQELDRKLEPIVKILENPEAVEGESPEELLQALLEKIQDSPDNYTLNLSVGMRLPMAGKSEEAIPYLEKAIELFPFGAGELSPYQVLFEAYEELGDSSKARETLQRHWEIAPQNVAVGLELGKRLAQGDDQDEATRVFEGLMFADPLKPEVHQSLGDLYLKAGRPRDSLVEFQILLKMEPQDMAGAHYRVAQASFQSELPEQARRHVLLALEIAPSYEEAQRLLLEIVRR